jgi:uncharacterized protein DUF5916/cellulose/xylan binding protein with CBM9 domain
MIFAALLLLAQTQAVAQAVAGSGAPRFTIPRLTQDATVDGRLDEPVWSSAVRLTGFSQYEPVDGRPAEQPTDVLVYYTEKALHFGIVAHVRPGTRVNATLSKRDNILNDDRVVIYLDTFNDRRRAFVFGVNPLGVQLDGVRHEGAGAPGQMFSGSDDWSPDYRFESSGRMTDSAYIVEVRIPFKSLRFPASGPQDWAINISRYTPSANTQDTWVDTRKASASFLNQSAVMQGIDKVERGIVTEWQPFVTGGLDGARNSSTGAFTHNDPKGDAGANFRVGFPAVSLDATVNPDFSQVEADVGLVTVNERFALFIPEKRPFFLEGIELFSTPNQLVYTRRVVSPVAGGKVTGKFGPFGLAHMTAVDDQPGHNALFNISRIRTDLGGNSTAGLVLTDRRAGSDANTIFAADSRYVFSRFYYLETQLGGSWTKDSVRTRSSPIYSAVLDRTGKLWGFHYSLLGLGKDFRSDAGFVPRTDYVNLGFFNRLAFYGSTDKSFVQSFWMFGGPQRIWRYGDFGRSAAYEGEENLRLMVNLRGGWRVNTVSARRFFTFDPSLFTGLQIPVSGQGFQAYSPTGKLRGLFVDSVAVGSPVKRTMDASVAGLLGEVPIFAEGAKGNEQRADLSLGYRPSAQWRLQGLAAFSRITRDFDGSQFARTFIPRIKVEYQPARSFFFRVVSELRDQRTAALQAVGTGTPLYFNGALSQPTHTKTLRTDWLISYEPTPGTVAYFGYGNTLEQPETPGINTLRRAVDGFFVKLAYQFRR